MVNWKAPTTQLYADLGCTPKLIGSRKLPYPWSRRRWNLCGLPPQYRLPESTRSGLVRRRRWHVRDWRRAVATKIARNGYRGLFQYCIWPSPRILCSLPRDTPLFRWCRVALEREELDVPLSYRGSDPVQQVYSRVDRTWGSKCIVPRLLVNCVLVSEVAE